VHLAPRGSGDLTDLFNRSGVMKVRSLVRNILQRPIIGPRDRGFFHRLIPDAAATDNFFAKSKGCKSSQYRKEDNEVAKSC
jgi:hypothetical protein